MIWVSQNRRRDRNWRGKGWPRRSEHFRLKRLATVLETPAGTAIDTTRTSQSTSRWRRKHIFKAGEISPSNALWLDERNISQASRGVGVKRRMWRSVSEGHHFLCVLGRYNKLFIVPAPS